MANREIKQIVCPTCGSHSHIYDTQHKTYECENCGNINVIPDDIDESSNLYDRAANMRRNNRFDDAIRTYNLLLDKNDDNAEAHFWIAMCRYGVNYVEDKNGKFYPTCWRYRTKSLLADYDYKRAIELASPESIEIYEERAKAVDRVQKKISNIISSEKPYDAFICYKETDDITGQQTPDSIKAEELYNALTEKGFRVFFARRTFKTTLVEEYEPYIYAALYSAKVMYILTSSAEYAESVWMKNEWQRFIEFKETDTKKRLRVLLYNLSPSSLPPELINYQAYDVSSFGLLEQLCKELNSLNTEDNAPKKSSYYSAPAAAGSGVSYEALSERAYNFLRAGEYNKAIEYFNKALDTNARLHRAYWGALMAEFNCKNNDELIASGVCPENSTNYQCACKYADENTKAEYEAVVRSSMYSCQLHFMRCINNNDITHAVYWANKYNAFSNHSSELSDIHRTLTVSNAFTELRGETAKALLRLLNIYSHDKMYSQINKSVTDKTAETYAAYMNRILGFVLSGKEEETQINTVIDLADMWADPMQGGNTDPACLGADGKPNNPGDRYLYIMERLNAKYVNREWAEFIYGCGEKALRLGADENKCAELKASFIESVLQQANSAEPVEFVISKMPEYWKGYWRYAELFKNIKPEDEIEPDFHYLNGYESFMSSPYSEAADTDMQNKLLADHAGVIKRYETLADDRQTALKPWLDKAFLYAGDKAPALQEDWNTYTDGLRAHCKEREEYYADRLRKIQSRIYNDEAKRNETENKRKNKVKTSGTILAAITLVCLLAAAYFAIAALRRYKNPGLFLGESDLLYTIIAVLLCAAGAYLSARFLRKFKQRKNTAYKYSTWSVAVMNISKFLTPVVFIGAAVLFIVAEVNFNRSITVIVSDLRDILLIESNPRIDYALADDLDLTDVEWKALSSLKGTLDGQGHKITAAVSSEEYLMSTNRGTIKNITFVNPGTTKKKFYIVNENKGSIENCTIDGFAGSDAPEEMSFYGFANNNKGTIYNCSVKINGTFNEFAGIANDNSDTIKNCSSTVLCSAKGDAAGIAMNSTGSIISSYAAGQIQSSGNEIAGIVRYMDGGTVEKCGADCVMTLTIDEYYYGYAGGIVAETWGEINIKDSYASGSIKVVRSTPTDDIEVCVGGLIGISLGSEDVYIDRCYTNVQASSGYAGPTGAIIGHVSLGVDVLISLTFAITEDKAGASYSDAYSISLNGYYTTRSDEESTGYSLGSAEKITENACRTVFFVTDTLEWSGDVWRIENGKLPVLKDAGAKTAP